jgi:hypothetical protein
MIKKNKFGTFHPTVLKALQAAGLARQGKYCCKEIAPHVWERHQLTVDFARLLIREDTHRDAWLEITRTPTLAGLVRACEYFTVYSHAEFPDLALPDRHWFACSDGLFHTRTGTFYPHGSDSADIPPGMVVCNYFDAPMHKMNADGSGFTIDAAHWCVFVLPPCLLLFMLFDFFFHCRYDVETNAIQSILVYHLEHLQWEDGQVRTDGTLPDHPNRMHETIQWFYALFGRLLFEVGEMDAWDAIPFIGERAGTGKSTLFDALAAFFLPENIELLDPHMATMLAPDAPTFLLACFDVKNDPATTIRRANENRIPCVFAGNAAAAWTYKADAILRNSRNLVVFLFDRKVDPSRSDPRLKQKIKGEMPQFLYKCCIAYLSAVDEFGEKDLWGKHTIHTQECVAAAAAAASSAAASTEHCKCVATNILPQYFHSNIRKLQAMTHPLVNFLRSSDAITTGTTGTLAVDGMPWERFKELANAWILDNDANNGRTIKWDEDKYKSVLDNFDIKKIVLTGGGRDYDGKLYPVRSQWLLGVMESRFAMFSSSFTDDFDDDFVSSKRKRRSRVRPMDEFDESDDISVMTKILPAMTHPLVNFLRLSETITTGTLAVDGMPFVRFKELANAWIVDNNANNGNPIKWDEDKYKSVLDNFDIKKIALTGCGRDYDGTMYPVRSQWLLGVVESRFADDFDDDFVSHVTSLVNFLRSSDAITTGTSAVDGMSFVRFKELVNAWIVDNNANNGNPIKWDEDTYKSVWDNFDIQKIALTGCGCDYAESRFAKVDDDDESCDIAQAASVVAVSAVSPAPVTLKRKREIAASASVVPTPSDVSSAQKCVDCECDCTASDDDSDATPECF